MPPTPLDLLANAMLEQLAIRTKDVSATPSPYNLHGPGSLLGVLGLPSEVNNAMVLPVTGLQAALPTMISNYEDKLMTILTGQTASTGEEATTNCGDGKQPGNLKICNQIWPFGRLQLDSQVLDITNVGRLINRGEFVDQTLVGNPFQSMQVQPPVPTAEALRTEVGKKITEMFVALYRDYGHVNFDGNPANTAASSGGYLEWNGLDRIINTGYRDVISGNLCPAADSLIINFNGAVMDTNAGALVTDMSQMVRAQKYLATLTGQAPIEFAFSMRYSAFLKLTEVWPCAYFTTMCSNLNTGSTQFVEAQRQIDMRNEMRAGMYILTVFGDRVPVIIDDFITETIPVAGTFQSDIYLVPLTHVGGRKATYFEAFNWEGTNGAIEAGALMAPQGTYSTLGGGQYLMIKNPPTKTCVQITMVTKKRLVCEIPFLAGRLTNVRYTVAIHERNTTGATPDGTYGYQPNGGAYYNYAPYNYAPLAA